VETDPNRCPNDQLIPTETAGRKKRFHLVKVEERFRIERLEERIAPSGVSSGGYGTQGCHGGGPTHGHNAACVTFGCY
jgi:hypothetical protein